MKVNDKLLSLTSYSAKTSLLIARLVDLARRPFCLSLRERIEVRDTIFLNAIPSGIVQLRTRVCASTCEIFKGGGQNVTVGSYFFSDRAGGGVVWVYRHRGDGSGNREVPVLPFPSHMFDIFHHRLGGGAESSVIASFNERRGAAALIGKASAATTTE